MNCNYLLTEKIIGVLVIVFAWWQIIYYQWILTVLGLALIWHAFRCKVCSVPQGTSPMKKVVVVAKKPAVKKKKKK